MQHLDPHRLAPGAPGAAPKAARPIDVALRRIGEWLRDHQRAIHIAQWSVLFFYMALIVVPTLVPLPERTSHIWSHVTLLAQFTFWGIWWPGVLLSTVLVGRVWCGLLCPEGSLSERASRHGFGLATPRLFMWKGWPILAFIVTTIYGQMTSVYQYPLPVVIILGGSTVLAAGIGLLYGRDKRVWCRFLCPVSGVFRLLAKLAPLHFRTDQQAWRRYRRAPGTAKETVNCAPMVPIGVMRGASDCHMCGRCSGFRDAIVLERRSPNHEIVHVAGAEPKPWETVMLVVALMGVATGAFLWTTSDVFIAIKQTLAEWAVAHDAMWLIQPVLPWWILTNYPDQHDVMVPADGITLIVFVLGTAAVIACSALAALALATRALGRWRSARFHHLAQCLIPLGACGVFLGLSALTITMLRAEGFDPPFVPEGRALLLAGAALWCMVLAWQITGVHAGTHARALPRRLAATAAASLAVAVGLTSWVSLFFMG
ncbi:ferredoxin [Blastochloris viridis]|uniref:Ferredoxin n=1 Tax=Blastochloris viridis TaxID=1079 RepID=A0A182D408_BLAVI|nr:ferredoxin [Blastochloris viridis]